MRKVQTAIMVLSVGLNKNYNKLHLPLIRKVFQHYLGLVLLETDTSCVLSGFESLLLM